MTRIFILMLATSLLACSKNDRDDSNGKIHVRFENETALTLENVHIGATNWGMLASGGRSEYQQLESAIYAPFCELTSNGSELTIGFMVCGTPMPEPMASGYYTFKIKQSAGIWLVESRKD